MVAVTVLAEGGVLVSAFRQTAMGAVPIRGDGTIVIFMAVVTSDTRERGRMGIRVDAVKLVMAANTIQRGMDATGQSIDIEKQGDDLAVAFDLKPGRGMALEARPIVLGKRDTAGESERGEKGAHHHHYPCPTDVRGARHRQALRRLMNKKRHRSTPWAEVLLCQDSARRLPNTNRLVRAMGVDKQCTCTLRAKSLLSLVRRAILPAFNREEHCAFTAGAYPFLEVRIRRGL